MILTRKAAIGFILLAILTFSVATLSYQNRPHLPNGEAVGFDGGLVPTLDKHANKADTIYVVKQGIDLGVYTPLVITTILELITLVGYIGLKKVEPRIKVWEERTRGPPKDGI